MNLIILPTIVVLLTALITPAHAQSTIFKSITPDSLATEITSAIGQKDYASAEQLFNNYDILGLEIPVSLKAKHAEVYQIWGKYGLASQELEQYLTTMERDSDGYKAALENYGKIKKFEDSLSHVGGIDEATDSLANKIISAIDHEDYIDAEKLFKNYEVVGLEIPVPLKVPRALVHKNMGEPSFALRELKDYLAIMGWDSQSSMGALALYRKIKESKEE